MGGKKEKKKAPSAPHPQKHGERELCNRNKKALQKATLILEEKI